MKIMVSAGKDLQLVHALQAWPRAPLRGFSGRRAAQNGKGRVCHRPYGGGPLARFCLPIVQSVGCDCGGEEYATELHAGWAADFYSTLGACPQQWSVTNSRIGMLNRHRAGRLIDHLYDAVPSPPTECCSASNCY